MKNTFPLQSGSTAPTTSQIYMPSKAVDVYNFLSSQRNWTFTFPNSLGEMMPVSDEFWIERKSTYGDPLIKITHSEMLMCIQIEVFKDLVLAATVSIRVIPKIGNCALSIMVNSDKSDARVNAWVNDFQTDLNALRNWTAFKNAS